MRPTVSGWDILVPGLPQHRLVGLRHLPLSVHAVVHGACAVLLRVDEAQGQHGVLCQQAQARYHALNGRDHQHVVVDAEDEAPPQQQQHDEDGQPQAVGGGLHGQGTRVHDDTRGASATPVHC